MGWNTKVSVDLERHTPFQASLHPFQDYNNECAPPRILVNFQGLLYLHQVTVFLEDPGLTKMKRPEVDSVGQLTILGSFFLVDLSKIVGALLTFTFILNKNEHNELSSVTYFIWANKEIDDVTILEGRYTGNFRLRQARSLKISTISDVLGCLGFSALRDFSKVDNLDFKTVYPIYRNFEIQTARGVEDAEMVEDVKMLDGFEFQPHSQTILVSEIHHFSDISESDVMTKTLFTDDYYPEMGIKFYQENVFIILENYYLDNFFQVPSSICTFCDQETPFLDPYRALRPVFAKNYWRERYYGSVPLLEYLHKGGAKGKQCFAHLPSFVLIEWWLKGMNSPFEYFQG